MTLALFTWMTDLVSGHWWTYLIVLAAAALDAVLPLVPSETIVIAAAVLSAHGHLLAPLIALFAAAGVLVGDNVSYALGRFAGRPMSARLFRSDTAKRRLERARELVQGHGGALLLIARFIPGGRTATTFSCGVLEYPWRRFLFFDTLAACLWALYGTGLGYFGGSVFKESTWKSLAVAFGIAIVVGGGFEVVRRVQKARGKGGLSFE